MEDAYNNNDVEGFVEHSVRNIIIAMDEEGAIGLMFDNLQKYKEINDEALIYIGLLQQGLDIVSRDANSIVEKAID